MLETYQNEIIRKRKAARIFWLIVFICSFFLYFFFQGYYPDVSVGLRKIFSESGSTQSGNTDLIRSFGIINVRTLPLDASITLGESSYGNNEKRMSDYGDYRMNIEKTGYLTNSINFKIDREKPFFIEKISLLPAPRYKKLDSSIINYFYINDSEGLIQTATGLTGDISTNSGMIFTGNILHIGGKFFQTNSGVLSWNGNRLIQTTPSISNFVKTCENVEWRYDLFYCPKSKSVLTESGKYMTGIVDIKNHLIVMSGSLIEIKKGLPGKTLVQSGKIDPNRYFIQDENFYISNSGNLSPVNPNYKNISTELDSIIYTKSIEDTHIIIGKKNTTTQLIIRHNADPIDRERIIDLPENLSYEDVDFRSIDGNLLLKSPQGILFIYRGSAKYEWITEGQIVTLTQTGTVYKKDNQYWQAEWSELISI